MGRYGKMMCIVALLVATAGSVSWSSVAATSEQPPTAGPAFGDVIEEEADIESQMPLCPTDDEETKELSGKELLFTDFCLQSRDIILGDIKRSVDDLVNNLFGLFYRSFELLGIDGLKVRLAANKSPETAGKTRTKSAAAGGEVSMPEMDQNQPEQAKRNGGGGIPLIGGIFGAIGAVHNAIASTVLKKLDELKRMFGLDKLAGAVGGTCDRVNAYERDIRARFEATKEQLVALDESIGEITFESLNCVTCRRMMRLRGICGFASHLQNPLLKLLMGGANTLENGQGGKGQVEMDGPI